MICTCGARAREVSDLDGGKHLIVPDSRGNLYISAWTFDAPYVERVEPGYDGRRFSLHACARKVAA